MSRLIRTNCVVSAVILFATVALAEPVKEPPRDSASPGTTRKFNVKTYPIPLLFRVGAFDFDFGISQSMTLGLSVYKFSYHDPKQALDLAVPATGVRLNYYFNGKRISDGYYCSASIHGISAQITGSTVFQGQSINLKGEAKAGMLGLMLGHHWVWDSGFNMTLGAGLYSFNTEPEATLTGTVPSTRTSIAQVVDVPVIKATIPWLEVGVGWAF
ncbi:MAG TPA: hypothetical protein VJB59_02850 [Bdellovibrionota bacterium]|nr:hypothetical protein [Bdellovibrionota bacterium]